MSRLHIVPGSCVALLLAACGDGQVSAPAAAAQGVDARAVSLQVMLPSAAGSPAGADAPAGALPSFHAAPILLESPTGIDALDPAASAMQAPHRQGVPAEFARLSTRRLTWQQLDSVHRTGAPLPQPASSADGAQDATPMATASQVVTYTPAQIRAAYALPAIPAAGASPSTSQAAQLGAGQTIYIVDAQDDPNVAAELAAFNQRFGLPGCSTVSIPATAALPLAAAPATGCTLSVVYVTSGGARTAAAPAYDAGWATEIAMDVQWAHATAPMARIVLLEAPDAGVNSLLAAVGVANAMGPGVVSMSFGANEGSWTSSVEGSFSAARMTYVASAGDSGAGVEWPAVSPHVVAVGGTSLTWGGSGARSEAAWSGTGGGVSAYTATPSWQTSAVPGMGVPARRSVTDVSFNADPATGQYVAVMSPGNATVNWLSAGGTSVSAPQWAGLFASANAQLAQRGQAVLGAPHALLYGRIATSSASYAAAFADVKSGANGGCATCAAKAGYDLPTGLGTPTASALLPALVGTATVAPVVTGGSVSGTTGTPLSFAVTVAAGNAVAYTLAGAPPGMAIGTTGTVAWATPVAGSWTVTVTAVDTVTGLSGQGSYAVTISAPKAPVVTAGSATGVAGTPFSYTVAVSNPNPVTWTLAGAPSGLAISSAGVMSWAAPTAGSWSIAVKASDAKTGLSGSATLQLAISPPPPPVVGSGSVTGNTASALSFTVPASSQNAVTFVLVAPPAGMTIAGSGVVSWPKPVAGKYSVTVKATDPKTGLSGQGTWTVAIAVAGPVISAPALTGVAGKPLSGTIGLSDATSGSLSVTISGIPAGMGLALSGSNVLVTWTAPVAGSYKLAISVVDGNGLKATATMPVTVTAK